MERSVAVFLFNLKRQICDMSFEFSKHALEQLKQRHISVAIANKALKHPDQILDSEGKKVYQSVIQEEGKNYLIRIFVNRHKDPNLVITVYKTSKIDKYYEGEIW